MRFLNKTIFIVVLLFLLSACSQNKLEQNENTDKETLLKQTEMVYQNLINKDWKEFAKHIHEENGLVYSPFANVGDTDDLYFSKEEIVGFGNSNTKYSWSWDQSGRTFEDTPNGLVDKLLKTHKYNSDYELIYDQVTFNDSEIGSGGSQPNTIEEVYPNALYVEYFHEPEEEFWHFWQALRFVYEEIDGQWYLVALVRGAHNP